MVVRYLSLQAIELQRSHFIARHALDALVPEQARFRRHRRCLARHRLADLEQQARHAVRLEEGDAAVRALARKNPASA